MSAKNTHGIDPNFEQSYTEENVKTFWIDTKIEGRIFENNFKEGEFDGIFASTQFKPTDPSPDHPLIAQMCKAAIRAAVVTGRVQPAKILSDINRWTNTRPGVSFAVASPVHAGQNICVTVTTASCFPGSIHPTSANPGQACSPEELNVWAIYCPKNRIDVRFTQLLQFDVRSAAGGEIDVRSVHISEIDVRSVRASDFDVRSERVSVILTSGQCKVAKLMSGRL
jgi:hypothetical protein